MKIKCNRAALHEAAQLASSIIPARTPREILRCAKLVADKDAQTLNITATDNEVTLNYQISQVQVETPGSLVLPADRIAAILHESTDETISLELSGSTCLVLGKDSRFNVYGFESEDFYPQAGVEIELNICSGHYYPESSFAVKEKVLGKIQVTGPDGATKELSTRKGDKRHTATAALESPGLHIFRLVMKRPGMEDPLFELKAIMVAGKGEDDPDRYMTGHGLEIVPCVSVSGILPGGDLPVHVMLDGVPVECEITVIPAEGRTVLYKAAAEEPARIKTPKSGKYLITGSVEGRGCSLVFQVGKTGGGQ